MNKYYRVLVGAVLLAVAFLPCSDAVAKGDLHNVNSPVPVTKTKIGKKTFHVSKMVVKAKPEVIWKILTDYNNAHRVFSSLKKCHLVEDRGNTKIVSHTIRPSGIPGTFTYVVEVKETAPRKLEWHRVKGAFREVDGYWQIEPVNGGNYTKVTYCAYINGGLLYPAPIIRRQIKVDMPQVMAALKTEAESVKIASRQ